MEVVDQKRESASFIGRKEERVLRELFLGRKREKMRKCKSDGFYFLTQRSRQCHGLSEA